jgi:deferrochelatase/peroxidase EfeB
VSDDSIRISRRTALKGSGLAAVAATAAALAGGSSSASVRYGFHGKHPVGVATPMQRHLAFGTFDVTATTVTELRDVLATWSAAAARLMAGRPVAEANDPYFPPADTGETEDDGPSSLTITIGLGPTLFDSRFHLASRRPAALIDLPVFAGDRIDPQRRGGDLCVQACADDAIVAFHAVRNFARIAEGAVVLRDLQLGTGQTSTSDPSTSTPRNLLGFKDGTSNVRADSTDEMDHFVWVDSSSDQPWMIGGTYLVARRIRVHLEEWSALPIVDQQSVIGRFRDSGAPLTGSRERDPLELAKLDTFGTPVIPASAHVRVAAPETNGGIKILRRGYNFTDGVDPVTGELDAGLMFICFQQDPRRQFVTLQNKLSSSDALGRYVVHTGSGLYACPAPMTPNGFVGDALLT